MLRNRNPSTRGVTVNDTHLSRGRPERHSSYTFAGWWRADTKTLNGGDVSAAADKSGAGNDVVQGSGALQPLWVASGQNGKPCVRFTSANSDNLSKASVNAIGTGPYTMVWVGLCADSGAVKGLFANNSGAGGVTFRKDASNNRSVVHPGLEAHSDSTMPTTLEFWVAARPAATAPSLWVKGVATTITTATSSVADAGGTAAISIGCEGTASFFSDSDWYEAILYLGALNTSARARLENYLHAWYGV